jgi:D-glycero-D-manno-heptose 1,7-bisphosphate phosphatase
MTGKALFLDRDGVINVDKSYVHRIEDFCWIPGIFDLARCAVALGLKTVVVTNQAGIGRGLYDEAAFEAVTAAMTERFAIENCPLTAVYHCPYHIDARPPYDIADHPERKPNPGMLLRAARDHGIDLAKSVLIGDRLSDIRAAQAAGLFSAALFGGRPIDSIDHVIDHRAAVDWLIRCAGAMKA